MSARRSVLVRRAALAALALVLGLALGACGGGKKKPSTVFSPTSAAARKALAGSPPPLAALHRQANAILDGGTKAMKARLAELRGHPVVVNKWASWCEPCRLESPVLQSEALKFGRQVGFVGVDVSDDRDSAKTYLGNYPLSYPSYYDRHADISNTLGLTPGQPLTSFYDRRGKRVYVHVGPYKSGAQLQSDIEHYLGARASAS